MAATLVPSLFVGEGREGGPPLRRIQQHLWIHHPRRVERALGGAVGAHEEAGALLVVPGAVVAADGVVMGDRAAQADDLVAGGGLVAAMTGTNVSRQSLPDKTIESFLFEMAISCQHVKDGMSAHGFHGNAVSQAVPLISAPFEECQTRKERFSGLRNDGDVGIVQNCPYRIRRQCPHKLSAGGKRVQEFCQDLVCRHESHCSNFAPSI
jgi:hypothetical protein